MEKNILQQFDNTTTELLETINLFSKDQFNKIPFEGSWTAGQVCEHLFKSESGLPMVLKSNSQKITRDPGEKIPIIESIFLDFSTKLKSPDFILPSSEPKDKKILYGSIQSNRQEIRELIQSTDLTLTFPTYPFPQLGEFTGLEWLTFAICHSKRHTRQLKNIYTAIS